MEQMLPGICGPGAAVLPDSQGLDTVCAEAVEDKGYMPGSFPHPQTPKSEQPEIQRRHFSTLSLPSVSHGWQHSEPCNGF